MARISGNVVANPITMVVFRMNGSCELGRRISSAMWMAASVATKAYLGNDQPLKSQTGTTVRCSLQGVADAQNPGKAIVPSTNAHVRRGDECTRLRLLPHGQHHNKGDYAAHDRNAKGYLTDQRDAFMCRVDWYDCEACQYQGT